MIQNIGLYAYQYNLNEVWQKTSYWNQNVVEMLLIPTKYWTVTCNLTVTSPQGNLATGSLATDLPRHRRLSNLATALVTSPHGAK